MVALTVSAKTVNEEILERAIRHGIFLERLKSGEANKLLRFLEDKLFPDLIARLQVRLDRIKLRGFDTGVETTQRYRDMVDGVRAILHEGFAQAQAQFVESLVGISSAEAQWATARLQNAVGNLGIDVELPPPQLLRSVVRSRPFAGRLLKDYFKSLELGTQARIVEQVNLGLTQGEGIEQIVRRVRGTDALGGTDGVLNITRNGARALVRTAVNHVSTHAREVTAEENEDLIKGILIVATLDARTTPMCQAEDGNVYPIGEGWRPPGHWGCRTTTAYVLKSYRELGFKSPDIPVRSRASMNGQVPASLTYDEWLRTQPAWVQNEALGVGKATLFREGMSVTQFVDPQNRAYTLEQLLELEGLELLN